MKFIYQTNYKKTTLNPIEFFMNIEALQVNSPSRVAKGELKI